MSNLRADTIANKAGTGPATLIGQFASKVWAEWDGIIPALVHSFNVSSLTDLGAGSWTLNLTNSMDTANYSASGSAGELGTALRGSTVSFATASTITSGVWGISFALGDVANNSAQGWGNLA